MDIQRDIDRLKGSTPGAGPVKMVTLTASKPPAKIINDPQESNLNHVDQKSPVNPVEAKHEVVNHAASSPEKIVEVVQPEVPPPAPTPAVTAPVVSNKRKRRESNEINESTVALNDSKEAAPQPPKSKKKRRSSGGSGPNSNVKKDKLYCICKTRYDPKK